MKTPEELAFDYALNILETRILNRIEREEARLGFLAGYQAAKDQLFEETGFRLKLFKDEDDAKAAYQEALDEIPEQAAFEDGYRLGAKESQPQWISVKDRLPEDASDVLIAWADGVSEACFCDDSWCRDGRMLLWVTHWMPLPQPPKEEV